MDSVLIDLLYLCSHSYVFVTYTLVCFYIVLCDGFNVAKQNVRLNPISVRNVLSVLYRLKFLVTASSRIVSETIPAPLE